MFNDATSIADAKRDAAAYLATMGPAVHGAGGDHHTYRAACVVVRDFGLPLDDGLDVLRVWNQSCQPPWSERQLRSKLRSAMRSGRHAVGAKLRKRLDADAAYDHVLYAIFTWAPDDERARALAALDRAVKWTGAMRKVPALERQAALFLALFEPDRVERGPERVRWLVARAQRDHLRAFGCDVKRDGMPFKHEAMDRMATPWARDGHGQRPQLDPESKGSGRPRARATSPCAQLPDDPEIEYARDEAVELFRRSLSPLEAKVFDRYGAIDAALADDLATTRDTVKSTRQRIRSKAKKWSTTGSTSTGAVAA